MIRIAALAELCLLAWGCATILTQVIYRTLGPTAIDTFLTWLRWLMA